MGKFIATAGRLMKFAKLLERRGIRQPSRGGAGAARPTFRSWLRPSGVDARTRDLQRVLV